MEIEKKHILKSYKSEQEAIVEVERIKAEKESRLTSSISGYNFEKPKEKQPPTNPFSTGNLDIGEQGLEDGSQEKFETENPDQLANKSIDLERPLPEREINNRIR